MTRKIKPQDTVQLDRYIPTNIYRSLKKIALEKQISFDDSMLEAWSEYITNDKEFLK